ncbi:helix-turn-helix domain-containing protein [Cryobacterium sp. TMS1-20-1]|uniref:helix-turn-helix domain-containing protein n=1 Tax=Cryobacterium sp. TMS1-20-1 TaxID=1259223 RepID=UPI00106CC72C|nr:XRE family transcriptional regulator [Cryobacterium sp. TMS1-20-1]TFC75786.1 helix-turn-helix domain-containing protein [Cryobacterium sp. TMS1-20-1]
MDEINATTLGARIREARERAGLKQGDLSSLVALDRTAVSKIEAGTRKITALELSGIARVIGVRMSSFFSEPLPALVSHRSSQGLETVDSKIDHLLAGLAADVELVQSLEASESHSQRLVKTPLARPVSNAAAEDLADTARHLLDLGRTEPVHELANRVAAIGLSAFSLDLGVDTADAGTILLRTGGVSLVNSYNKVGKRRLALAHELGHYLVADDYTIDWRISEHSGDIEATLDRFARALLLPKRGLRGLWEENYEAHGSREAAVILASEFRVDMATLARRLRELEIVDSEVAAFIRTVSTTRADIVEFGLNVPTEMEATSLPVTFQKGVLRLVREEKISRERALGLLQNTFDEEDLPPLRTRREDELWKFVS